MLSRILQWMLMKSSGAILILALGVAGFGAWLYWSDALGFEERKAEFVRAFTNERAHLLEALKAQEQRQQSLERERQGEVDRLALCARTLRSLGEMESTWDMFFGDRAKQRELTRRRDQVRALQEKSTVRLGELETALRLEAYTKEGLGIALGRLEKRIDQARATESKLLHYARRAWERCRNMLLLVLAGWFFGPLAWKLTMYHGFARLASRGRPLRFSEAARALPEIESSKVALEIGLAPGEWMRVKERFLQASDESLEKRTRWLFDWSMPFTSLACGLVEMIEIRNSGSGGQARATLSCSDDPLAELSQVRIPEGASLILSPRHIAGLMQKEGSQARIRRRWVFWRWQAWVSLQFRYFEFVGPMQIVLSGSRGIRVERLSRDGTEAARRVNHNAIIGFTPDLCYTPVRAETFWAYYRGMNPLFDDRFEGEGLFLCQASAQAGEAKAERFWASVWNGVLRIFGL